ncbi:MAG: FAD-dependent oxidoreductase [Cyanobacteria bacterium P01_D01_bin.156]
MATIAVVGAGIAGLTCGQRLRTAGHEVIWLEKSRGVGGRMATRRLGDGAWADHGLRQWPTEAPQLHELTNDLKQERLLVPWSAQSFLWQGQLEPQPGEVYCSASGINAIAKHLAQGANIQRQQQVTALIKTNSGWRLTTHTPDNQTHHVDTDAVVLAIPAPQAHPLLSPFLDRNLSAALSAVSYAACLSLMATYRDLPNLPKLDHARGWHITTKKPAIAWVSLESSKPKISPETYVLVIQSQAEFASDYLKQLDAIPEDQAALDQLQNTTTAQLLEATTKILPGLGQPATHRLQRWRYSTVSHPYPNALLKTSWDSLVGCGDWCGSRQTSLENAYTSGIAAAEHIRHVIA